MKGWNTIFILILRVLAIPPDITRSELARIRYLLLFEVQIFT